PRLVEQRMQIGKDFWDANPEARDALVKQNLEKGRSARTIENELLEFVNKNFEKSERILLAGNSIHQDRKFIDNEWPRLSEKLHYRMLDVSAWKVVFDGKYRKKFAKRGAHRALDDIRGSIEEIEYYLKKVNV
ncbi:oligoribonuclease, partial [Candidatus Saccharibacteria bacterium]|nr:oligoribonuclease [Candidatus Saccharibacteria bacterium]